MSSVDRTADGATFRCGAAARWLPRVLAAALLVSGLLVSYRVGPKALSAGWTWGGPLVAVAGAAAALWILRNGAELRTGLTPADEGLVFLVGRRKVLLRWDEIDSLAYAPAFSSGLHWLPATILGDRQGRRWRISALLDDGPRLVETLLTRTGRSDLEAWASALRLALRMGRPGTSVAVGYTVSAAVLAAAVAFYVS